MQILRGEETRYTCRALERRIISSDPPTSKQKLTATRTRHSLHTLDCLLPQGATDLGSANHERRERT